MPALADLPDRLAARPRWIALMLGVLAACGFQPLALWPLALLAVAGLIELIGRAANGRQAALLGWLFGAGHFILGLSWIATAFTFQAKMPSWLGWIAVVGLSLYLAIYPALAALAAWRLRANYGALIAAFAASWIVSEWLRAWVFTGFPWNPLASVALGPYARPGLAALAPWLGTYGLSGLVVVMAGSWLIAAKRKRADVKAALLVLLPVALMLLPATAKLENGTLALTLVQPNVPEDQLNNRANFENQFAQTAKLSAAAPSQAPRLVLWPESGAQDYLEDGYPPWAYADYAFGDDPAMARGRIAATIGGSSLLLTGGSGIDFQGDRMTGARNTIFAIDGKARLRGRYAKWHLVPYGEYVPMRWLLEPIGLSRLVPGDIDFNPGPGPRTLDLGPWGKAGMLMCYEVIFSGDLIDRAHRPDYLFNPSNDGWYGSWGPPQHLAQARLRAIEEGLPVLRSTTTGISAVIDADGVVRASLPLNRAGRIDGFVPPAHAPTLFARLGNMLPLGWAALLLVLSLVASRRRLG